MNLIIFGATGLVGTQLVKQALHMGHNVKAYGRNIFSSNLPESKSLEIIQGALFDDKQVSKAMRGCDAVLSALGGATDGTDVTRSLGMKTIVSQMEKINLQRIVGMGGWGILNANEETMIMDTPDFSPDHLSVTLEHFKAYNFLKESTLDWTFVCPPEDIMEAAVTGVFTTNADYLPKRNKFRIGSGDLAMFMLKALSMEEYVGHRVGISN